MQAQAKGEVFEQVGALSVEFCREPPSRLDVSKEGKAADSGSGRIDADLLAVGANPTLKAADGCAHSLPRARKFRVLGDAVGRQVCQA